MSAILARLLRWHIRSLPKSLHVWTFAVASVAVLLSWPAAAQSVTFCDETFAAGSWTFTIFSGNVVANTVSAGGEVPSPVPCYNPGQIYYPYLNVNDQVPASGIAYGVNILGGSANTYNPGNSGAIGTISFSLSYECPDNASGAICPNGGGQAFGAALMQGGNYYVAPTSQMSTGATTWKSAGLPFTQALTAAAFSQICPGGVICPGPIHPDFSSAGAPIQCGFYTANSTSGGSYQNFAGYDDFACTITPPGILKVCKVAGAGIPVGTLSTFTAGSNNTFTVPAGPPPGGTCVVGPSLPVGTNVTVTETIPPGDSVLINVTSTGSSTTNPAAGSATLTIGSGVNEVTYTNQAPTGYIEICKRDENIGGIGGGQFAFTVTPGNSGPIIVPANACSPAIQVPAGNVTIRENPISGVSVVACSATPPSQQIGPCDLSNGILTVQVVAGGVPTQTIASFTNQHVIQPCGKCERRNQ